MKKLILLLFPIVTLSQTNPYSGKVGINTQTPTTTLDVNGNLRIRQLDNGNISDSILVVNNGKVKKIAVSDLMQPQNSCPTFVKNQSTGFYLLFTSSSSIQNPNNSLTIQGKTFVSAGTWIANNTYYFSYSNTSGNSININNFVVNFGSQQCHYNQ